ncbi:hypothetical protein VTP01DRAFT_2783 [Rhizomucor pusillus]|uniref:uncharacterized protein n=1 Tax=Rhizomucor pusillus TaxID=4840 RepID=UPI003742FECF
MAGLLMKPGDYDHGLGPLSINTIKEFRGRSYLTGGDRGASTVANFIKYYNSAVQGLSHGSHLIEFCQVSYTASVDYPKLVLIRRRSGHPRKDGLNAALSGALAMNLDDQVDYLIKTMKRNPSIDFENDWKMIVLNIGNNDQCATCSLWKNDVTPEKYKQYVEAAISRIKAEIPRTVVQILGAFKVSQVYQLTRGQSYCHPLLNIDDALLNHIECSCFLGPDKNRKLMDSMVEQYNQGLQAIYKKFKSQHTSNFAPTMFIHNLILMHHYSVTHDIDSNIDCFHPNFKGHSWIAKTVWNLIHGPPKLQSGPIKYSPGQEVYCPTEQDRILI